MIGSATVTAKVGPGNSVSSLALADVKNVVFDIEHQVVGITYGSPAKTQYFEMTDLATGTLTFVAGVSLAVVIST